MVKFRVFPALALLALLLGPTACGEQATPEEMWTPYDGTATG